MINGNKEHNAYTNHLFEIASISIGSKDSILLQQSGHDVFKELWTQQHAINFKKFSLIAEKQEAVLMTDKW